MQPFRSPRPSLLRRAPVAALLAALAAGAGGLAGPSSAAAAPALRFGIYPGGGVGKVVDDGGVTVAEDARRRKAALGRLRGDRDFVLHIYSEWTGGRTTRQALTGATFEAQDYTAAGYAVELVIRYRPSRPGPGSPAAYARHVRAVTNALAGNRGVVGIQIANEPNVTGAPDAADGAYPGVRRAIVEGVVAAKAAARRAGRASTLSVGFNWAAAGNLDSDAALWRSLRRLGGARFDDAVDWVGADIYPGTWSDGHVDTPDDVRTSVARTLAYLRGSALPLAGLGRDVAIHIAENGFPTGPDRSEAEQAALMEAAIRAIDAVRVRHGVTDYRWFDLRDAGPGGRSFENGYGVLRADYSEKPGFAVLARLVGELGAARPATASARRRSG